MKKQTFLALALVVQLAACMPATQTTRLPQSLEPEASLTLTQSPSLTPESPSSSTPGWSPSLTPESRGEPVLLPSPNGRWTAILSREPGSLELEDPRGVKHTVFPEGSTVNGAQWSSDGKRLAVASTNLPPDWQYGDEAKIPPEIHVVDIDGGAFAKAESIYQADREAAGARIFLGAWSPDNRRLRFWLGSLSESLRADGFPLWVLDISDGQAARLAEATLVNAAYQSWAPDGSALVFTNGGFRSAQVNKWLSLYEVASGRVKTLVPEDELVPGQVAWSPAGEPVAFAAVEAGQTGDEWANWMGWDNPAILGRRIYLLDPQSGQYQRFNAAEAHQDATRWSADGETLYYVQIDGDRAVLMAADPATGAAQPLPGCQAPRPSGAGYYGQTDWKDVYESCPETSARNVRPNSSIKGGQTYTDPAGQFRVCIPAGWRPGDAEGVFSGPDGALRTGYLPEMAFMDQVYRVCERLANTPGGPARKVILSPGPDFDACTLVPYAEMSIAVPRLVVANRAGRPEQRYFFLETDQEHLETIAASLQLLNAPAERESFPYPAGPMRPNDEAFWEQTSPQPSELTVEEYAVADASLDDPTHLEFRERIPDEVFQKRAAWRGGLHKKQLAGNNTLLKPFGYSLRAKEGSEMELYELHRGEDLLLDEINEFWPVSVNASASDFALVLGVLDGSYRLVRRDTLEDWDMATSLFIPPVFSGDDLLTVRWDDERSQAQVREGDGTIVSFASVFLTGSPVKGLWSWQGHWLLEVDGFLIRDGENLNERLGFEEIFGWQLLNGKPFYYFRRGPRVGISYDGQVLPVYYDDIVHYRCCEPAAFNNAGNEAMVWFYGLREGTWYYVEIGAY